MSFSVICKSIEISLAKKGNDGTFGLNLRDESSESSDSSKCPKEKMEGHPVGTADPVAGPVLLDLRPVATTMVSTDEDDDALNPASDEYTENTEYFSFPN